MDGTDTPLQPALASIREGDVIGFSGKGIVCDGINIGTYGIPRWGLSHIGIASRYRGRMYIFESTTLNENNECAILKRPVQGVQAHLIEDILHRPGKVWLYPLSARTTTMTRRRLSLSLLGYLGLPYDYRGAFRSRGYLLRFVRGLLFRQEISELFCSELVALVLTEAKVANVKNSSSQSPNSLARRLVTHDICIPRIRIK
jgi:hypothetical protein